MKSAQTQTVPFANKNNNEPLTVEALIKEAVIAGVSLFDCYDYTFGELIIITDAYYERQRREHKMQAIIAQRQAQLISAYVAGEGNSVEVYEVFPFWTEEEEKELRIQKYKQIMERWVATTGGGK